VDATDSVSPAHAGAMNAKVNAAERDGERSLNARRRQDAMARRLAVYERHLGGESFRSIASALGISISRAHGLWQAEQRASAALDHEPAAEKRATAKQRLEGLLGPLMKLAAGGNVKAASVAIDALERSSKVEGLDAPYLVAQRVDVTRRSWDGIAQQLADNFSIEELRAMEADAKRRLLASVRPAMPAAVEGGDTRGPRATLVRRVGDGIRQAAVVQMIDCHRGFLALADKPSRRILFAPKDCEEYRSLRVGDVVMCIVVGRRPDPHGVRVERVASASS
jgi:hypothetical protein